MAKRKWIIGGIVVFSALFLLSGTMVLRWYLASRQSNQEFSQIAELVGAPSEGEDVFETNGVAGEADSELVILERYRAVYEENQDFIGWITIDGTRIDYPVVQSMEDPDFYLKHNFDKKYSSYGVPYLQTDCDLLTSDNLIIHGHHMNDDSMFSDLCQYAKEDFYQEHKTIRFDTKFRYGVYEVIAVFRTVGNESGFMYHHFVDAQDAQEFDDYVAACKELALYETDTTAQYGDRLITLSTCEYTRKNGRMIVVAKLLEETTQQTEITGAEAQE